MCILKKIAAHPGEFSRRRLTDSGGVALITALMFTLISLVIAMSMMYIITQSTKVSGTNKRYKTAIEASYGGAELLAKDMIPFLMVNFNNSANLAGLVGTAYSSVNAVLGQGGTPADVACLQAKLRGPSSTWPAGCSNTPSPTDHPDLTYNVLSATGNPYKIYSKIVETKAGNTDTSGLQLEGEGVAEASSSIAPMHNPYIYRLEVQGQQSATSERANIEVLYAY